MATRIQVSDALKSIRPTKQMRIISVVKKNTRKYNYDCGSRLFDVLVFNKTEFSQTNCHFLITLLKEFLKHKKPFLDVALLLFFL